MAHITSLPHEVLSHIVHCTEPRDPLDLLLLQQISRSFYHVGRLDEFWRPYRPDAPAPCRSWRGPTPLAPYTNDAVQGGGFATAYAIASRHTPIRVGDEGAFTAAFAPRKRAALQAAYLLARIGQSADAYAEDKKYRDAKFAAMCAQRHNRKRLWLVDSKSPKSSLVGQHASQMLFTLPPASAGHTLFCYRRKQHYDSDLVGALSHQLRRALAADTPTHAAAAAAGTRLWWQLTDDFELVQALLPLEPALGLMLPSALLVQGRLVQAAVAREGIAFGRLWARPRTQHDAALFQVAIAANPWALQYGTHQQRNDAATVGLAARGNAGVLYFASPQLRANEGFMLRQVQADGMALEFADEALRASPELVLAAIARTPAAAQFVGPALLHDDAWMLRAAGLAGRILRQGPKRLLCSRPHVLAAVASHGDMLEHVHRSFRDDDEVVAAAVASRGTAIEHASARARQNPYLARLAVEQAPQAIFWLDSTGLFDDAFLAHMVGRDTTTFAALSDHQQKQPLTFAAFVRALAASPALYEDCGSPLHEDDAWTLQLFWANPLIDAVLAPADRTRPDVLSSWASAVLAHNGLHLRFFSEVIRANPCHVAKACAQNGLALAYAHADVACLPAVVRGAVQQNGLALAYAGPQQRDDATTVALAVAQNCMALEYASKRVRLLPALGHAAAAWRLGRAWLMHRADVWREEDEIAAVCTRDLKNIEAWQPVQKWNDLWSRNVPLVSKVTEVGLLGTNESVPREISRFCGEDALSPGPTALLADRAFNLGRWTPPPLLSPTRCRAPLVAYEPVPPRAYLTARFCGAMALHSGPAGLPMRGA